MSVAPTPVAPRMSVIIPTWNGADLLVCALRSLHTQTFQGFEIIVVDNGSTDGTPALLARDWPHVRLIPFGENRGFAAAVNAGIRAALGEVVVLANNDVEARADWLAAFDVVFDRHAEVGACASRMLLYDDRSRIDSAGDQLGFFAWSIGHGELDGPAFRSVRYILSPCAGAAAYRRAALDDAGLFDERFFAYLEDVDLGVRLQLAGWRCLYVPDAVVYHHGSATAKRMPELKLYLLMRNSLFLFFQYMPASIVAPFGPLMLLWPFWRTTREWRSPGHAIRAIAAVIGDTRAILHRREEVRRTRRITTAEFRARLAGWIGRGFTHGATDMDAPVDVR